MAKGLLAGMTDYNYQSFKDILEDIRKEQQNAAAFKNKTHRFGSTSTKFNHFLLIYYHILIRCASIKKS